MQIKANSSEKHLSSETTDMRYQSSKINEAILESKLSDSNKAYAVLTELDIDIMVLYHHGGNARAGLKVIGEIAPAVTVQLNTWLASIIERLQAILDYDFPDPHDRALKALRARAQLFIDELT